MRFILHCTYWSLLFTTLISSCFLFYIVASENAKYVIKSEIDASMASDSHDHTQPLSASMTKTKTIEQNAAVDAPTADDPKNQNDNAFSGDTNVKVLPNYKKIKKLTSEQQSTPAIVKNIILDVPWSSSITDDQDLSTPYIVKSGEIVENNADNIKSSDSIIGDADENSRNSLDNKNLFNIIDENTKIFNENDKIHASIEKPTEKQLPQQVPDVELRTENDIKEQHVHDDNAETSNDLPDITDIPTLTVTELPLEILQQPQNTLDSVIIDDGGDRSNEERISPKIQVISETEEKIQKDDQIVKINDSGGDQGDASTIKSTTTTSSSTVEDQEAPSSTINIPIDSNNISTTESTINVSVEQQQNTNSTTSNSQVNLTAAEEVPMPVFSEWAQKQMEAAEKQQALEQEQTVNNSAQRKNNTNGNGKPASLKIRAKNYASPDCGAKIIASSAYTSNAGAVLSSSKDEYMLSLCGNRIWFVVELCEAIQAQKIDFANFELYSSSPQNFTVAVSKRFPTREWSNVGRFQAEDKRTVQSFDLHPHLFGKFVRVDINSHYSKEHFCTLSLFRVFGTSEFEAFETENHPNEDLDDFDDEYLLEQNTVKHAESNLFKSASDAVLSIVKKATEVLGKPSNNQNQTFKTQPQSIVCRTPIYGLFSCAACPTTLVEKVNNILSCEFSQLNSLLNNEGIKNDLLNTRVCAKVYGIETSHALAMQKDVKNSFYVSILPNEYVGALCQLLATPKTLSQKLDNSLNDDNAEAAELPTNLTIEKKFDKEDLNLLDHPEKKLIKPEIATLTIEPTKPVTKKSAEVLETSTEINLDDSQQLPKPFETEEQFEVTTLPPTITQKPNIPDTNIFNVPADELSSETDLPAAAAAVTETLTSGENYEENVVTTTASTITTPTPTATTNIESSTASSRSEEDSNSWDNIENLLTTVPVAVTVGSSGGSAQYNQQKNSNGPQSESVFIRLSNRIKALERNMSLSGQYLEELSRRYKKQVEELQLTLTQQLQTVRTLEEDNRRHHELEQLYALQNTQLKDELNNLTLQVHACIVVIIFVGAFLFLVLMVGILFYRSLRRQTKEVLSLYDISSKKKNDTTQKKINRRKSFEDFSDRQQPVKCHDQDASNMCKSYREKCRRPSEEAMLIIKDCNCEGSKICQQHQSEVHQLIEDVGTNHTNSSTVRQRKISVCYGSNNNINQKTNQSSGLPPQYPQKTQNKRKGEKHSWPNTAHAQLQAWKHLEELNAEEHIGDSTEISSIRIRKPSALNGKSKKKKETQIVKRQQSSPAECGGQLNSTDAAELSSEYNERLMLDEDDLDNFIPNSDLAYNEFMPDGPRGYQCVSSNPSANIPASKKVSNKQLDNNLKKSRRLSSPVFFKSPFTKSLKGKISNSNKSNPAHESTSWEWYRLKKSTSSASSSGGGGCSGGSGVANIASSIPNSNNSNNNAFLRVSPNVSLDSSSLSEINFPTNSTENSFRILEEAILSSGESAITTVTTASSNCIKSLGGLSSSSNSNRSSSSNSSTQSKKKNRSFNRIFRKVF